MYLKCVIVALLATSAWGRSTSVPNSQNSIHEEETARSEDGSSYLGDFRYVYKVYQECAATDLTSCLKLKLIAAMDRAARSYIELPIFDGLTFVKDGKAPAVEVKSENEIEASLPRALSEKEDALNSMIADRISNFFETHTLQVKLPSSTDLQRSFNGESRGKKRKGSSLLLLPLILAGTLVPLALGALALLAGKALIVSKLALVLAGIIGLKKLLSGHGHDAGHVEVVSGGHGSGWGRAYEAAESQKVAYSAYAPKTTR